MTQEDKSQKSNNSLARQLRALVRGEVFADNKTRDAFSRDASIFVVRPEVVVAPADVRDLENIVLFASKKKKSGAAISVTARSGGTDMGGGPLNESIIIDFARHLNTIESADEKHVVVEPGAYYRDVEKINDGRGVMIPSYPASRAICTVGGMVANNSGGEKTLAYGKTEQYVEELNMVFADGKEYVIRPLDEDQLRKKMEELTFEGQVYRQIFNLIEENYEAIQAARPAVSKNSAGYYLWNVWDKDKKIFNLCRLIVGSQGTLGLVTKIKFRLIPKKKYSRLAVLFLKDIVILPELTKTILAHKPESFESYDDNTLRLALRFLPDIIRSMKFGNFFSLLLQFVPEALMTVRHGIPKLVLLAELTDNDPQALDARLLKLKKEVETYAIPVRITKSDLEAEKYWTIRRESFNLLRKRVRNRHTAPFIDDIIVRPEFLPELLPRLDQILKPYAADMTYTIAGHVGDGNFHIIPLMDFQKERTREIIGPLSKQVYELVLEFHGSITAEHNDGLIRSPYLEIMYGKKMCGLFERVKDIFDPQAIFNPGKKVKSDFEYTYKHIRTNNET